MPHREIPSRREPAPRAPRLKVAYLGGPGSYSQIGCAMKYPGADHRPYPSFAHAFEAVRSGTCDLGLVPIENAIAGRVADVRLLLQRTSLFIVGEVYVPIDHCLLGLPGADLSLIGTVHSHPQALAQCGRFLAEHGFEAYAEAATSTAAIGIVERGDPAHAAIAHRGFAASHELAILAEGIQDVERNVTRFIALGRDRSVDETVRNPVTTILLDLGEGPRTLHGALEVFAHHDVPITRIESYTARETFCSGAFLIDFEGSGSETRVRDAIDELSGLCCGLRSFGTYEGADAR